MGCLDVSGMGREVVKVERLLIWAEANSLRMGFALFVFHGLISLAMYSIGCSSYFSSMHNGLGMWNFAPDSIGYHKEASQLLSYLQSGDMAHWWSGAPEWEVNHPHTKLISLVYLVFGPYPYAYELVNGLTWVGTCLVVYLLAKELSDNCNVVAIGTAIFMLMPTYFLQTTQLLKDPIYILGVAILLFVLSRVLKGKFGWKLMCISLVGFYFCIILRPYMQIPLSAVICTVFLVASFLTPKIRKQLIVASIILLALVYTDPIGLRGGHVSYTKMVVSSVSKSAASVSKSAASVSKSAASVSKSAASVSKSAASVSKPAASAPKPAASESMLVKSLNNIAALFQRMRTGLYTYDAGSQLDADVVFKNWTDAALYLPRALQLGFLAPFPADWLIPSYTAGEGARLLAGAEMMVLYVILIGFVVFIFIGSPSLWLRLFLLLFTVFFVLLLAMAVPNMGSLYRMRYPFVLPIILGGVQGLWIVFNYCFTRDQSVFLPK